MRDALTGRVAIVTGASRGIGAAIARRFAAEGARVAIVARSLEPGSGGHLAGSLREVAAGIEADGGVAVAIVADLSDPACDRAALVARVAAELGPVDVLVNNAAACFYLSIDDTSGSASVSLRGPTIALPAREKALPRCQTMHPNGARAGSSTSRR